MKMRTPGSTSPAAPVKRHVLEVRETRQEGTGLLHVEGVERERESSWIVLCTEVEHKG